MKALIGLLVAAWLLVPVAALADQHAIKLATKDGVGTYLADDAGKTLYWFKRDMPGVSNCAGPCVEKWPLFYREAIAPVEGTTAADFATIKRADGKEQTTFRGYPLYYWSNDAKPGDTNGQGINDVWYVVDPGKFPPK
jgi:predicted lipoprotein with Yx(FWY)xxD motif